MERMSMLLVCSAKSNGDRRGLINGVDDFSGVDSVNRAIDIGRAFGLSSVGGDHGKKWSTRSELFI
jgi:hypothetical protein